MVNLSLLMGDEVVLSLGNFFLAFERDLAVIPVLNKVDLKTAIPDLVMEQMKNLFDMQDSEFLKVSAKTGLGVSELLDAIVDRDDQLIIMYSERLVSLRPPEKR